MTATTEEGIDPTLHMTLGMMIATTEGEINPTLHTALGTTLLMIGTIEEADIVRSLEVLHYLAGAQGGAILVASHPSEGASQDEAIPAVCLPDQEAQGEATLGAYPRDQGKVSHIEEVRPSEQTPVRVTQGVHLGVGVQVPDPCLDQ